MTQEEADALCGKYPADNSAVRLLKFMLATGWELSSLDLAQFEESAAYCEEGVSFDTYCPTCGQQFGKPKR